MSDITIIGNLTAPPELRFTSSGKAVANFTVAVNRGRDDAKETDFYRVTAWEGLAENLARLDKGVRVIVTGQMRSREYEDRDGNRRTAWEITARAAGPDASYAQVTAVKVEKQGGEVPASATADWSQTGMFGGDSDAPF